MLPLDWTIAKSVGAFSWLMTGMGGNSPQWAGGSVLYKKAGWANHREQASNQHSSMVCVSVPASRFLLWASSLVTTISWNKPFVPQVAFGHDVYITLSDITSAKQWWHTPLILALRRQRQENLYEFEASLIYEASSRTARAMQKDPALENQNQKQNKKTQPLGQALNSRAKLSHLVPRMIPGTNTTIPRFYRECNQDTMNFTKSHSW